MFALEIFTYQHKLLGTREDVVEHVHPFGEYTRVSQYDAFDRSIHFELILWSQSYFCFKCGKIWATRVVLKGKEIEEFSPVHQLCPSCGPVHGGWRGGYGRLFADKDLIEYLDRLPVSIKVHEFLAIMEEINSGVIY